MRGRQPPRLPDHLRAALMAMPGRERLLLKLRYGDRLLMREIGERLQISTTRVRALLMRAEYRLARRIVYPGLDPLHRFDRRKVPSNYVPPAAPDPPERRPPRTLHWTSEPGPPVALAPFGTLGDIIEMLEPHTKAQRRNLVNRALEALGVYEIAIKEAPSDVRRATLD